MTIGEKIRQLRRAQNVTQEKLAEYLGLSFQAISKWENNTATPDLAYIIPLANFFGVTTDTLFDLEGRDDEAALRDDEARRFTLMHEGRVRDALALCREVTARYPRNYAWLNHLASVLLQIAMHSPGFTADEQEAARVEGLALCRRIMADAIDDDIRTKCRQTLVYFYDRSGDADAALAEAEKAPSIYLSREILSDLAWTGESPRVREIHDQNLLTFTTLLTSSLIQTHDDTTDAEQAARFDAAFAIWAAVVTDGNYLFYHAQLAWLHKMAAITHTRLGDHATALAHLRTAMTHAQTADALPEGEHRYTAPFIRYATYDSAKTTKNYTTGEVESLREDLRTYGAFKPLRGSVEFDELCREA